MTWLVGTVDIMVPPSPRKFAAFELPSLAADTFGSYFLSQNAAIDAGTVSGVKLNLKVLGVGDGLTVRSIRESTLLMLIL